MHGQIQEAVSEFRRALELNPESGAAHRAVGQLLREIGDPAQAAAHYREALRIAPGDAEAHADLGQCLMLTSRPDEALKEFAEAMRLEPDWPPPMALAAMLLSTHPDVRARRPEEAVRLASRAAESTHWKDRGVLEILAAAYAAAGNFDRALDAERKALALVPPDAEARVIREMEDVIDLYRRGLPRK